MKKLLLLLLLIPIVSFGQDYKTEKDELMEKIKSWDEKKAFYMYKDLVLNVQDRSVKTSKVYFPNPNDFEKQYDKEKELLEVYKIGFIKKYKKDGMSKNMITALDWYGTMEKNWAKEFKNLYQSGKVYLFLKSSPP